MRNQLKVVKKGIDDEDRARKAAVMGEVVNTTVALLGANPGLPYLVYNLQALANNKAVDGALKQVKALNPDLPAIFISGDVDTNKVLAMAYCPKSAIEAGLKANEWCGSVLPVIGGKVNFFPNSLKFLTKIRLRVAASLTTPRAAA